MNNPNDSWICSRFYKEWHEHNSDITTSDPRNADIIWIIAPWKWFDIPLDIYANRFVICTIHHIATKKFHGKKLETFKSRDRFVNAYHVPCLKTKEQIEPYTTKPIYVIPFWVNNANWYSIEEKANLRSKFEIDTDAYVIGSFQRDTEGNSITDGSFIPKLEKGPDLFCDSVEILHKTKKNVKVLLAGWRRQYVMKRLNESNIPYYYFELPDIGVINQLYNCLDLYIVAAREEGGPQSIVECASSKTPIISTDVGLASEILSDDSIFLNPASVSEASPNIEYAYSKVKDLWIDGGFEKFKNMINNNLFLIK